MVALSAVVAGVEDGLALVVTGILARLDVMLLEVGGNNPVIRLGGFCESLAANNLLITDQSSGSRVSRGIYCFIYGSYI